MKKIFMLNGHHPYPFSKGALNATFLERAAAYFKAQKCTIRTTHTAQPYDIDHEIDNHQWADFIIMQFPVNWMGVSWSFKKYMDDVYSAGMDGRLCNGDGRSPEAPKANYGMGGSLKGKRYMLSATLNAPEEAFANPDEPFFAGMSLDDLLRPVHLNAKFFGLTPLPSFAAYDVMKNPQIDNDLTRFESHLTSLFAKELNHDAA